VPVTGEKRSVLGVCVDVVDYDAAAGRVMQAARTSQPLAVSALAVHGVMTAVHDPEHRARLNELDLVTADGQPVRWALNLLHHAGMRDRVYGPELTWRVLQRAAAEGLPVYLYGSTEHVLARLQQSFTSSLPALCVAGAEPSKFRDVDDEEAAAIAGRIRASGARLVLVGLGCPRQEVFVWHMRELISLPLLAVGAAFDYHAGLLRRPPSWMQRRGLEWLWRLGLEPRRLWRRYVLLNPAFAIRLLGQWARVWHPPASRPAVDLQRIPA